MFLRLLNHELLIDCYYYNDDMCEFVFVTLNASCDHVSMSL